MANNQGIGDGNSTAGPLFTSLAAHRQLVGYGLLGLAALLAVIPITLTAKYGSGSWDLILWGALATLVLKAAGLVARFLPTPQFVSEPDLLRFLFLSVGGLLGLLTAYLGLLLILGRYRDIFTGPLKEWGRNSGTVWGCVAALFGGMILVFLSLLLARGVERSSVLMRRLIYGFNAVFTTLLLLAILILCNIMVYAPIWPLTFFQKQQDWTAKGIYTLSPSAQTELASLKKPVKVIVMLARQQRLHDEVATLLDNCHYADRDFTWEEVPFDNTETILGLQKKYVLGPDEFGLIVLYGEEPNQNHTLIKEEDLSDQGAMDESRVTFKGEAALTKALEFLSNDSSRPVIYFTQGGGELKFGGQEIIGEPGMGLLTEQLGKGNYDLRELQVGPELKTIPQDADVVVVARPTQEWPPAAVTALGDYLKGAGTKDGKKGRAVFLFDVVVPRGEMARTGLEDLLAEFNVKVGNNRLIRISEGGTPTEVMVLLNPELRNAVTNTLISIEGVPVPFIFRNARTVEPQPGGANPSYVADVLLETYPRQGVVLQTDLKASPGAVAEAGRKDFRQGNPVPGLSGKPLPVALIVSESKRLPPGPEHQFLRPETQPRLVVFGAASWVGNEAMAGKDGTINYNLFANCLYWLREKPPLGQLGGQTRDKYELHVTPPVASAIEWLPLFLMPLGILVLGLGVWVVRRR